MRLEGTPLVGYDVFLTDDLAAATEALRALDDPSRATVAIQPFGRLVPATNPTEGVDTRLAEARMANLGAASISGIRLVQQ